MKLSKHWRYKYWCVFGFISTKNNLTIRTLFRNLLRKRNYLWYLLELVQCLLMRPLNLLVRVISSAVRRWNRSIIRDIILAFILCCQNFRNFSRETIEKYHEWNSVSMSPTLRVSHLRSEQLSRRLKTVQGILPQKHLCKVHLNTSNRK